MNIYLKERQPDFLIIGVQRGGTTSLYSYLVQHPQIVPAEKKEVHFFDLQFSKGVDWYREQFPIIGKSIPQEPILEENKLISGFICGEASPYYIFHPLVPERIYQLFPQIKLIVLLRDPVARAISHYHHEVRLGYEYLPLEEAIAQEEFRLKGEVEKIIANADYYSFNHQHYTYLSRGIYVDPIVSWMNIFPKEQFLIIKSEEFYNHPNSILKQVFEFLNLPEYELSTYEKLNGGDYLPIEATNKQKLQAYFQPYNQKLEDYLGRKFDW